MKKIILILILMMTFFLVSCGDNKEETKEKSEGNQITHEKVFSEFNAVDINNNKVNQDIISKYDYTIVDIWGTYCNPCIEAMPDMQKAYEKFKKKGVGVLGIAVDIQNEDGTPSKSQMETAKYLLDTQKVNYPNITVPKEVESFINGNITAIPTAFIVDKEGNIVSELYIGGKTPEQWEQILNEDFGI